MSIIIYLWHFTMTFHYDISLWHFTMAFHYGISLWHFTMTFHSQKYALFSFMVSFLLLISPEIYWFSELPSTQRIMISDCYIERIDLLLFLWKCALFFIAWLMNIRYAWFIFILSKWTWARWLDLPKGEWWWVMMSDDGWWWMMMNDDEWWWMMMNDDEWQQVLKSDMREASLNNEWWWVMVSDGEWWWVMTSDDKHQ